MTSFVFVCFLTFFFVIFLPSIYFSTVVVVGSSEQ